MGGPDAVLVIDDSHATGVLGKTGRGTPEHFGMLGEVDVITSTLGNLAPLFAVAIAVLLLHEPLHPPQLLGLMVAVAGPRSSPCRGRGMRAPP